MLVSVALDPGYSNIPWLSEKGVVWCVHGCGYEIHLDRGMEI